MKNQLNIPEGFLPVGQGPPGGKLDNLPQVPAGFVPEQDVVPQGFEPEPGATWGETLEATPGVSLGGVEQGVGGLLQALDYMTKDPAALAMMAPHLLFAGPDAIPEPVREGYEQLSDVGANLATQGRERVERSIPERQMNVPQEAMVSAVDSVMRTTPGVLAAYLMRRSPNLSQSIPLGSFGLQTGGQTIAEGVEAGLPMDEAIAAGRKTGAIEAFTETGPFAALTVPGKTFLKRLGQFAATEIPGELVAENMQNVIEAGAGIQDTLPQGEDLARQQAITVLATLMGGGPQVTMGHALDKLTEPADAGDITIDQVAEALRPAFEPRVPPTTSPAPPAAPPTVPPGQPPVETPQSVDEALAAIDFEVLPEADVEKNISETANNRMVQDAVRLIGEERFMQQVSEHLAGIDPTSLSTPQQVSSEVLNVARDIINNAQAGAGTNPENYQEPRFARRLSPGTYEGTQDYMVPELPQFEQNNTGDLGVINEAVTRRTEGRIKQLPIRMVSGLHRGRGRGYGAAHIAQRTDQLENYSPDPDENIARNVYELANSYNEVYEEGGNRVVLRDSVRKRALVLKELRDRQGFPFYSVISLVPSPRPVWGEPVWTGRRRAVTFPQQDRASAPPPDMVDRPPAASDRVPRLEDQTGERSLARGQRPAYEETGQPSTESETEYEGTLTLDETRRRQSRRSAQEQPGRQPRGADPVLLQQGVDDIRSRVENAPEVIVVPNVSELPEAAVNRIREEQAAGHTLQSPDGLFLGGKVYLVASELSDVNRAAQVFFHEVVGHRGLRGLVGDRLNPLLDDIIQAYREGKFDAWYEGEQRRYLDLDTIAREYGLSFEDQEHAREVSEEYLARLSEYGAERSGFLARIRVILANLLRRIMPRASITKAEVDSLLSAARGFISRGEEVESPASRYARRVTDTEEANRISRYGRPERDISRTTTRDESAILENTYDTTRQTQQAAGRGEERRSLGRRRRETQGRGPLAAEGPREVRRQQAPGQSVRPDQEVRFSRESEPPSNFNLGRADKDNRGMTLPPEFWDWFGDSNVTQGGVVGGVPLVMYHGTQGDFNVFEEGKVGTGMGVTAIDSRPEIVGEVWWMTSDPLMAEIFATREARIRLERGGEELPTPEPSNAGPNIMPLYAKIENPGIVVTDNPSLAGAADLILQLKEDGRDGAIFLLTHGYDLPDGEFVEVRVAVFNGRKQLKSATGNLGTFDPGNEDIRFSRRSLGDISSYDDKTTRYTLHATTRTNRGQGAARGRDVSARAPVSLEIYQGQEGPRFSRQTRLAQENKEVQTGTFHIGLETVHTPEEAAHVLAPLRKAAIEEAYVLLLDADRRPLSVARISIGTINGAGVYPREVAGVAHNTEGARYLYFAHNHPSGKTIHSNADHNITTRIRDLLRGTDVRYEGSLVITPGGKASFLAPDRGENYDIRPKARPRRRPLPVTEGRRRKSGTLMDAEVTDAYAAPGIAERVSQGKNGLMLLDNSHAPVGFFPMELSEVTNLKLRSEEGRTLSGEILKAMRQSGAAAVIGKFDGLDLVKDSTAVRTLNEFLKQADVSSLDTIADGKSLANEGVRFSRKYHERARPKGEEVYFSPAFKALDSIQMQKGTPQQWMAALTKTPGVKKEELDWMDLDGFLKGKKSVTKDEVTQYIKDHMITVDFVDDLVPHGEDPEDAIDNWTEEDYDEARDALGDDYEVELTSWYEDEDQAAGLYQERLDELIDEYRDDYQRGIRDADDFGVDRDEFTIYDEDGEEIEDEFDESGFEDAIDEAIIERARENLDEDPPMVWRDTNSGYEFEIRYSGEGSDYDLLDGGGYVVASYASFSDAESAADEDVSERERESYRENLDADELEQWLNENKDVGDGFRRTGAEHKQYTVGRGEGLTDDNLHNVLLTLPEEGEVSAEEGHFGRGYGNVLAWGRSTERATRDGESMFLIEEVQSDHIASGRTHGFRPNRDALNRVRIRHEEAQEALMQGMNELIGPSMGETEEAHQNINLILRDADWEHDIFWIHQPEKIKELGREYREAYLAKREVEDGLGGGQMANVPWKQNWPLLVFKRLLLDAVASDAKFIGWVTGEIQAERWSGADLIDELRYIRTKNPDGIVNDDDGTGDDYYRILGVREGETVLDRTFHDSELDRVVGRDVAKKMRDLEGEIVVESTDEDNHSGLRKFSNLDLKLVHKPKHVALYDEVLRNQITKYLRKFGAKLTKKQIAADPTRKEFVDHITELKKRGFVKTNVMEYGAALKRMGQQPAEGILDFEMDLSTVVVATMDGKLEFADPDPVLSARSHNAVQRAKFVAGLLGSTEKLNQYAKNTYAEVHAIEITDKMREAAKAPQPMFSRRRNITGDESLRIPRRDGLYLRDDADLETSVRQQARRPETARRQAAQIEEQPQAARSRDRGRRPESPQQNPLDSPEFRRWFGDSNIVDDRGEPITVYHGGPVPIEQIDMASVSEAGHTSSGLGFFLTENRDQAENYGEVQVEGYVRIENPYVMSLDEFTGFDTVQQSVNRRLQLKRQGYDGIVVKIPNWLVAKGETKPSYIIAFDANQVKSADNVGTFSREDDRIRYARRSRAARGGQQKEEKGGMLQTYRRVAKSVLDYFEEVTGLDPFAHLAEKKKFLARRYEALGDIAKGEEIATKIKQAFYNADADDQTEIYNYLTTAGANAAKIKNKTARDFAVRAKQLINDIGDALVRRGLLDPIAREAFRDRYLPRIYLKHLLNQKDYAAIGSGKKPSNLGYLKHRKDIPAEVREVLLGEVKDPAFLTTVAVDRTLRDLALLDWLESISHNENWVLPDSVVEWQGRSVTPHWLKHEAQRLRNQARHYTNNEAAKKARDIAEQMDTVADEALGEISGEHKDYRQIPDQPRYGFLRGLYVRQEIFDDIMGVGQLMPDQPGWFQNLFGYGGIGTKLTQLWKLTKVPLNPPSQVRNFVSNMVLLQLSGIPLHRLPDLTIRAINELQSNGRHWQIAKKYGVTESTFTAQEVLRVKRDLLDLKKNAGTLNALGKIHRIGGIIADHASDFYQFMEALGKTMKIIHEMENGVAEQDAVIEAQKWLFDYSLVPKSVRYARNAPVGIPFVTFYTKVLPRLIEVALLHPQRYLPWVALFQGWQYGLAAMLDVDDDDLEALKEALPKWLRERGHVLMLPWKDEHGRWQFLDMGYFMPWAMWTDAITSAGRGDVMETVKDLGLFSGPLTDALVALKTGKDPFTERYIIPKGAPPGDEALALMSYLWGVMAPPWLTERGLLGHTYRAITGKTDRYGQPRTTGYQAALRIFGVNNYAIEPELSRTQNLRQMRNDIYDVMDRAKYLSASEPDPEKRQKILDRHTKEAQRRTKELQEYEKRSRIHPKLRTR